MLRTSGVEGLQVLVQDEVKNFGRVRAALEKRPRANNRAADQVICLDCRLQVADLAKDRRNGASSKALALKSFRAQLVVDCIVNLEEIPVEDE